MSRRCTIVTTRILREMFIRRLQLQYVANRRQFNQRLVWWAQSLPPLMHSSNIRSASSVLIEGELRWIYERNITKVD
jgi:hypothetical protein